MFEFEIMVTGYTLAVAGATTLASKFVGKKKLNKVMDELSSVQGSLMNLETEIKKLKIDFSAKTKK